MSLGPFQVNRVHVADCLEAMQQLPDECISSVVTDPPYFIEFMGLPWDQVEDLTGFHRAWAEEALRVLKPGGHLLSFAATRTFHRMTVGIEDAGFEVRDLVAWSYGTGYPKGTNVARFMDDPEQALRWQNWNTTLKPAIEPVLLARKPVRGTVCANILEHGVGALDIDGCRVGTGRAGWNGSNGFQNTHAASRYGGLGEGAPRPTVGRYPANLIIDGKVEKDLPGEAGKLFYIPKPSKREKGEANKHPTCKPLQLMRYLVRMTTPPGGVVLDPFAGSGTTILAAWLEGVQGVGFDNDESSVQTANERLDSEEQARLRTGENGR